MTKYIPVYNDEPLSIYFQLNGLTVIQNDRLVLTKTIIFPPKKETVDF